jgi:hypothetical protein
VRSHPATRQNRVYHRRPLLGGSRHLTFSTATHPFVAKQASRASGRGLASDRFFPTGVLAGSQLSGQRGCRDGRQPAGGRRCRVMIKAGGFNAVTTLPDLLKTGRPGRDLTPGLRAHRRSDACQRLQA